MLEYAKTTVTAQKFSLMSKEKHFQVFHAGNEILTCDQLHICCMQMSTVIAFSKIELQHITGICRITNNRNIFYWAGNSYPFSQKKKSWYKRSCWSMWCSRETWIPNTHKFHWTSSSICCWHQISSSNSYIPITPKLQNYLNICGHYNRFSLFQHANHFLIENTVFGKHMVRSSYILAASAELWERCYCASGLFYLFF